MNTDINFINVRQFQLISNRNNAPQRVGFNISEGIDGQGGFAAGKNKAANLETDLADASSSKRKSGSASQQNFSPENFIKQLESVLKERTLLFKMMETMGGTDTAAVGTGRVFDTYV